MMLTATFTRPWLSRFAALTGVVVLGLAQSSLAQEAKPTSPPATQPTSRPAAVEPKSSSEDAKTESSSAGAIALADLTMKAMGGKEAWNETRYIAWNFFGSRRHIWDKHTGNVRIEFTDRDTDDPIILLMNIITLKGSAWRNGEAVEDAQALAKMLQQGKGAWINDSYWLLMPYKLKDPGVTLKSLGKEMMEDGRPADVIQLTFTDVGNTPQNKYHVYVAKDTQLVEQWDFFSTAEDAEPRFKIPWLDWKRHGRIMLSGNRGQRNGEAMEHTGIAVFDELPESIFTNPEPVELSQYEQATSDR